MLACIRTEEVVFEIVFIEALTAFVTLLSLFLLRPLRYDLDYGLRLVLVLNLAFEGDLRVDLRQ